jgi:hypothetical protein
MNRLTGACMGAAGAIWWRNLNSAIKVADYSLYTVENRPVRLFVGQYQSLAVVSLLLSVQVQNIVYYLF